MEDLIIENVQNPIIESIAHADISECNVIYYQEDEVIIDNIKINFNYEL